MEELKLQNRRIAILTAASLSRDPRAFKEAKTIASAGFQVVVCQRQLPSERLSDRSTRSLLVVTVFHSVCSVLWRGGIKQEFLSFCRRVRTRAGVDLNRHLHIENSWQLGPAVVPTGKTIEEREKTTILHIWSKDRGWAHSSHRSGSRVAPDMEGWYSENLPFERENNIHEALAGLGKETPEPRAQACGLPCLARHEQGPGR